MMPTPVSLVSFFIQPFAVILVLAMSYLRSLALTARTMLASSPHPSSTLDQVLREVLFRLGLGLYPYNPSTRQVKAEGPRTTLTMYQDCL